MTDHPDLDLALQLADIADAITLPRFRSADLRVTTKPDRTPVTDADTAAEDALRAALAGERPGDAVLGEERGGSAVPDSGRGWVIDPIDGTKAFSRGLPVWATLISLTVHGVATVGVASAPALGRRWWGATGAGAWTSDLRDGTRRIAVSGVAGPGEAQVSTTDRNSVRARRRRPGRRALRDPCGETRAYGDFWQHCLVAEGAVDLAVEPVANEWDLAALQPIVEEAGGRFTDLHGTPGYAGGNAMVSNGLVHDAAITALRG
ncbi:MAG: histidinol-phosphatase [Pseudonocardia sp.]|nr:histidinol-phosphatase [Pseudonocardia sp.]